MIYLLLSIIFVGSLHSVVTGTEKWPFSPYPMFSRVATSRSLTQFQLYGVPEGEPAEEFPLIQYEYTQPFDNSRIDSSLQNLYERRSRQQDLREALHYFLSRYEMLRVQGRHQGPPLVAIRLYRVHWAFDPIARNVDRPDSKELLGEVDRDIATAQR